MTTETLQPHHIANNLPYGLKVKAYESIYDVIGMAQDSILIDSFGTGFSINDCLTIMHHISSLTKPVKLKGYGEPVVPIVELAKIAFPNEKWASNSLFATSNRRIFSFEGNSFFHQYLGNNSIVKNQVQLFDWLNMHHFNYRGIPDNLVEYITDEFNPYTNP